VGEVGGIGFFHSIHPGGEIPQTPFFYHFLGGWTNKIVTIPERHHEGIHVFLFPSQRTNHVRDFGEPPHEFRIRINTRIPDGFRCSTHGFRKPDLGFITRISYKVSGSS
jgi:hypothetical protein